MNKPKKSNIIAGVLFLLTALLNLLNIDYSDYVWLDFAPATLSAIAGLVFIWEALKNKEELLN